MCVCVCPSFPLPCSTGCGGDRGTSPVWGSSGLACSGDCLLAGTSIADLSCVCVCVRYYAVEFDWLSEVVSIRRLEPVSKLDKKWHKRPMAIEGGSLLFLCITTTLCAICMCVCVCTCADPFDLCHNLASRIGITSICSQHTHEHKCINITLHSERKYIVERFQAALRYHSSNIQWRSIVSWLTCTC